MNNITLVVFTCQGKEHLLPKTYESFRNHVDFQFSKIVLALDGHINESVIDFIKPDIIVQNHIRKGYIFSILNALALVDTKYFFWLEDDFDFLQKIDLNFMISSMENNQNWCEIILKRDTPLSEEEKKLELKHPYYQLEFGFSASPVLCRTEILKEGFQAIVNSKKDRETKLIGFENFLTEYLSNKGYKFPLLYPGDIAHVNHIGLLESTDREYHMINSLDKKYTDVEKNYISGFGADRKITVLNKVKMILNLILAFGKLLSTILTKRASYDYALRIVIASKKAFKN